MNAIRHAESPSTPRDRLEAAVEPMPPLLYRSEAFAEDLEPEEAPEEGLLRRARNSLGALLFGLPLGSALLGAGGSMLARGPF
jgi:hypothetical protein